ncbi:MAG: BTAD domain-containing putative transcriptional regulator [Pseudomonadota bacterium]
MSEFKADEATLWLRSFGVTAAGPLPLEDGCALGMKALALMIYLAEHQTRPVTRDALVDLLWERVTPAQGKGSLRQEIRRIKKTLGDDLFASVFEISDNYIALRPTRIRYDATEVMEAAASENADQIARLLDLATGEFLADNSARSEPFQQWAMERRAFLNDTIIAALTRLAWLDLDAGRLERVQQAADRIVTMDPLHERGHEFIIRCHLAGGRRAQARAHFERFRNMMLRELGSEPEEDLSDLVANGALGQVAGSAARKPAKRPRDQRPTIAVLNVSRNDGGEQSYIADGVAEQLVANLSRSTWIKVASLNVGPFLPVGPQVESAQRDLRDYADYVLRVDVRVFGQRVAVTATLNRIADNQTVFSSPMEDGLDDLMAFQRKVALRIASIFEPAVVEDQTRKEAGIIWDEADDVDHWRFLMRARSLFWTLRREGNVEARALLGRALEIKADDVPSHCILAFSHMLDAWSDWVDDPAGSIAEAQRWAGRAVRINPDDAWAQFTLGVASSVPDRLDEARGRQERALVLSPSLAVAIGDLGRVHVFAGDIDQGIARAEEALELSPYDRQSGLWIRTKALGAWMRDELEDALGLVDYALVLRPGWFQNHLLRAAILAEQGREDLARSAFENARKLVGDYSHAAMAAGHPFRDPALLDRFADALKKAGAPLKKT